MTLKGLADNIWILNLMLGLAIANFLIFGLSHETGWKDAADYSAYAKNLLLGKGYSLDGVNFNIYREPGVSFYLMPFYKALGIETPVAIFTAMYFEAILLGILAFLIYLFMRQFGQGLALIAAIVIATHPILGDHTFDIGTETLFTFFVVTIYLICARIMRDPSGTPWYWYALLGLACGYQTLVRMQFVLFLPFIAACFIFYLWYRGWINWLLIRNTILALTIFAILPLSFATYVYANTGVFAVTQGRDNEMLYYRAVRAELSYGEITQYLRDWLWRSISGGINTQFLTDNDLKKLGYEYGLKATTSEAVATIRAENIRTILSRPGHYLYGNVVEIVKLAYIEHDYSGAWPRIFRPIQYAIMYAFFLFGAYQFFRAKGHWDVKSLQVLAMLFIAYNTITLSFLNVVPRFNTPYLPLFILVGFLGVILYLRKRPLRNLKIFD